MKLVILAGKTQSSNILFNALKSEFHIEKIVFEAPLSRLTFLKKRIKKLGLARVISQTLFRIIVQPLLKLMASTRVNEIRQLNALDVNAPSESESVRVASVNSPECIEALKKINPDLVIVNGTRIISKQTLNSVPAKFINIHAGITPKYRGVHGGYWAKTQNDLENCGVTLHLVDAGIDTGAILGQSRIEPKPEDNFVTYPLLQLTEGIKLLKKHLKDQNFQPQPPRVNESKLWHHPTIGAYFYYRFFKNVK